MRCNKWSAQPLFCIKDLDCNCLICYYLLTILLLIHQSKSSEDGSKEGTPTPTSAKTSRPKKVHNPVVIDQSVWLHEIAVCSVQ